MKKLILFSSLISPCFSALGQDNNAGTMLSIYQDINPDTLLNYTVAPYTNETYGLSFYTDLVNNLEFTARGAVSSGGSSAYVSVHSLDPHLFLGFGRLDSVYVPATSSWNVTKIAKPFSLGEALDNTSVVWDTTQLYLTDHSGSGGGNKDVNDWVGADKYIGLKYMDLNDTTYGWIRVECVSEDSCYIKDFSYSALSLGITNITKHKTVLYPNPSSQLYYLTNTNSGTFDTKGIKITDINGSEIKFTSEILENGVLLNLEGSAAGVYTLRYNSGKTQMIHQIIKSDN
ncbi:MAG: T9SS type A sorting domain-containing protein [Bacteroidia bacterium]